LRDLEPDDRAGYSIFLFDLSRPEARRAWDAAIYSGRRPVASACRHSTG
jgi:hypothetical protein